METPSSKHIIHFSFLKTGCFYLYDCVYNIHSNMCYWSGRVVYIHVDYVVCFVMDDFVEREEFENSK